MKKNCFRVIAVAMPVFVATLVFMGCNYIKELVSADSDPASILTLPYIPFSGNVPEGTEEPEEIGEVYSAIKLIRAAAGQTVPLILRLGQQGTVPEKVRFAVDDLPETGLVLTHTGNAGTDSSPARVTIDGAGRVIQLTGAQPTNTCTPLITVGSGVTLILRNITFAGLSTEKGSTANNNAPLIKVERDGHLILDNGAVITGNINALDTELPGGGVYVKDGTFTMKTGGEISANLSGSYGGGVYVDGGTFKMKGGEIKGNRASNGGGVYVVSGGTFEMSSRAIIGDNQANLTTRGVGGGVAVSSGTFIMEGKSVIRNNTCSYAGGGVYVEDGIFTKTGGTIYGATNADGKENAILKNTAASNLGHAVYSYSQDPPSAKKRDSTAEPEVKLYWPLQTDSTDDNWDTDSRS